MTVAGAAAVSTTAALALAPATSTATDALAQPVEATAFAHIGPLNNATGRHPVSLAGLFSMPRETAEQLLFDPDDHTLGFVEWRFLGVDGNVQETRFRSAGAFYGVNDEGLLATITRHVPQSVLNEDPLPGDADEVIIQMTQFASDGTVIGKASTNVITSQF